MDKTDEEETKEETIDTTGLFNRSEKRDDLTGKLFPHSYEKSRQFSNDENDLLDSGILTK